MKPIFKQLTTSAILMIISTLMPLQDAYSQVNRPDITITRIADLQQYTLLFIKGEVIKIIDEDEFRIQENSGRIKVDTGRSLLVVTLEEKIIVKGFLDSEFFGLFKEFYATEIIRENGEIIKIKSDD